MTVVLHSKKMIFVHHGKAAGSSISARLWMCSESGDWATPMFDDGEDVNLSLDLPALNNPRLNISQIKKPELKSMLRSRRIPRQLHGHMSSADLKRRLGEERWQTYHKVGVIREPIDQAVSLFFWDRHVHDPRQQQTIPIEQQFKQWLLDKIQVLSQGYEEILRLDGRLCLDTYLDFHNLSRDVSNLWSQFQLCGQSRDPLSEVKIKTGVRPAWATASRMVQGIDIGTIEVSRHLEMVFSDFPDLEKLCPLS